MSPRLVNSVFIFVKIKFLRILGLLLRGEGF